MFINVNISSMFNIGIYTLITVFIPSIIIKLFSMLYLIKCSNFSKVGYASDIIKRIGDYYSQNPCFELLGIKEGSFWDKLRHPIGMGDGGGFIDLG